MNFVGRIQPLDMAVISSDSALSSMLIETKLKQMGYSDVGISSLEWGNIIILIEI